MSWCELKLEGWWSPQDGGRKDGKKTDKKVKT
jgi:hypothetical protein